MILLRASHYLQGHSIAGRCVLCPFLVGGACGTGQEGVEKVVTSLHESFEHDLPPLDANVITRVE